MKADFWHERWESGRTGFHQDEANRYLVQYWPGTETSKKVFVPMCGKSRDMLWLRERGHEVIGVELSPIAVRDFFKENGLNAESSKQGVFERWESDGIVILCGDIFKVTTRDLEGVGAVYDRAAIIALPPDMRSNYANHLCTILPQDTKSLLVTIDYPQNQRSGPPFSVPDEEVRNLFCNGFEVAQIVSEDVKNKGDRIGDSVDYLNENAYWLTKV